MYCTLRLGTYSNLFKHKLLIFIIIETRLPNPKISYINSMYMKLSVYIFCQTIGVGT